MFRRRQKKKHENKTKNSMIVHSYIGRSCATFCMLAAVLHLTICEDKKQEPIALVLINLRIKNASRL